MLNGFKNFFEASIPHVPHDDGIAELRRMEKGHYLLAIPADHQKAWSYFRGTEGLQHIDPDMIVTADRLDGMSKTANETIIVVSIPKRWFTKPQLEAKGITGAIGELLPLSRGWKLPANYVWGYFSKWDENHEENREPGQFYHNPSYHGHDGLFNAWKQTQPTRPQRPAGETPRLISPHNPHGYRGFHGYNTAFDDEK